MRHRGFTVLEAVVVLVIVAAIIGAMAPAVRTQLLRARVNRAAGIAAADLYLAQALAARQRQPIRVLFNQAAKTVTLKLTSPPDSTVQVRYYGAGSEFNVPLFTATPDTVQVLPNGMANGSVVLQLSDGRYTREIRMSRAGQIRVVR